MEKKLTTILCSDVIGYSKMMGSDEIGTLQKLDACRQIIDPLIETYKGRIFNTAGDAVLAEFISASDAVLCATEIQNQIYKLGNGMRWRIGLHLGEVFVYGTNLMGDAVNIAARIESAADYGGVCLSDSVFQSIQNKVKDLQFESRGQQQFKNIVNPVPIWAVKILGSEQNPNAKQKVAIKYSKEQLIKGVINDKPAQGKTLQDAQNLKRDNQFGPAVRVLMWRVTRKCGPSLDELIDISGKNLVPGELKDVVVAVLSEYCKNIDSDRCMKIFALLQGPLGYHTSLALQFLRQASKTSIDAQLLYCDMIINDPNSSGIEIEDALEQLGEIARKKNIAAMLKLSEFYQNARNWHKLFLWLWVLRGLHDPNAQGTLEMLTKIITKTEFTTWKIEGEALLDEIKFKNDPANYKY